MEKKIVNILGTEYTIEKKAYKDEPVFEKEVLTDIAIATQTKLFTAICIHMINGTTNQRKQNVFVRKRY